MEDRSSTIAEESEPSWCPRVQPSRGEVAGGPRLRLDRAIRAVVLTRVRMEEAGRESSQLEDALARRLELSNELTSLSERLYVAAGRVARVARQDGLSPEHMVILLKEIVESNALETALEQEIGRQVVESGIDAYYAAAQINGVNNVAP